ncbi:unnamed protein product [Nippostrongylus brasiliensis]|uniref:F-box domain-containing protein n=1 Tax=Nippostrongylus brasiliensis TaxID=27835 RepID=A0A0N4YT26_NIPBR|nr:unnamed protein product [Nippostrongylus brasiliensis]
MMNGTMASCSDLPPEMIEKILENVDPRSLRKAQAVCSQWREIINRRRHTMQRYRVKEIYISDDHEETAVTLTITHLSPSFESISTLKVDEHKQLFDCLWIFSPRKLTISATRNELRTALEVIPDWWFHDIQMVSFDFLLSFCLIGALS